MKHEHAKCEHKDLIYCRHCDLVACDDCDIEWESKPKTTWAWSNGATFVSGSNTTDCNHLEFNS